MASAGHLVKGPWSEEEDEKLLSYIRKYGHGHWESLARKAGLNRTGKSCRLRWMNYLRPGIRRGNISLQEQLIILQLHSRWGNRWAKIAECLPGRSDNEIKNYWRTRVQKQARQLQCEVNSHQFREKMHHVWMPQLAERVLHNTQSESSPVPTTQDQSQSLPINSKARSHSDVTPFIPFDKSYNDWNENVTDISSSAAGWLGVAGLDVHGGECETHQPNCEKRIIIPCEDLNPWSKQELEADQKEQYEVATAWYDHDHDDNYCLENLLNDEDMMLQCQQLLEDHLGAL